MRTGWGLAVGAFCFGASLQNLYATSARLDEVRGDVTVRAPGAVEWEKATPGDKVDQGATVRTGANSLADILTDQGHHFRVNSESTLELTTLQPDDTKALLQKGRVLSQVKKLKPNQSFGIQTPTAVCAVRGTEFDTTAGSGGTIIAVYHGVVGVALPGSQDEVRIPAGQMTSVHNGSIDVPRSIPRETRTPTDNALARVARHEVGLDMTRNEVIAAAAEEMRLADYREGKSLIDVNGQRVRIDEYIVRPAADQFKLVALDKRDERLDYFFYKGTFNQNLPTDLSVALKDLSGKIGSNAPDYYLTAYEMGQSNTQDSLHDTATGGHLVKITRNGSGNYVLTDQADVTHTRTVLAAEDLGNGTYKIYNPIADNFSTVTAAQLASTTKFGVYIPENDTFRDLAPNDTLWKTRFNTYNHLLNNIPKIAYAKSGLTNVLASDLDATWTIAGGFYLSSFTTDPALQDRTITLHYGNGTFESYRTIIIDDQGNIAPASAFGTISTGTDYKGELLKWNYQQILTASEFEGRKIDLVVEPKIFIKSGLIQ